MPGFDWGARAWKIKEMNIDLFFDGFLKNRILEAFLK
jgi:hypothetical protein